MHAACDSRVARRLDWLFDWLYPPRCRACGALIRGIDAEYFCASCRRVIEVVSHPLCSVCGRPFFAASGDDHPCGDCLVRPPPFVAARAWACYPRNGQEDHPLRRVVQRFKYGRKVALGKPLGRLLASECEEFLCGLDVDLIVAVPLHPKRLRWRGFNQSVLLAREVSRRYRIALDYRSLRRAIETPPQTLLSEEQRRSNVRGAFTVERRDAVRGKRILVIDDVYTSGATVQECCRALNRAGAKETYVLTLARAV